MGVRGGTNIISRAPNCRLNCARAGENYREARAPPEDRCARTYSSACKYIMFATFRRTSLMVFKVMGNFPRNEFAHIFSWLYPLYVVGKVYWPPTVIRAFAYSNEILYTFDLTIQMRRANESKARKRVTCKSSFSSR